MSEQKSYKPFPLVFTESLVVGGWLIIIFVIVMLLIGQISYFNIDQSDTEFKKRHNIQMFLTTFLSGGVFHLLCEYSGINIWYSKEYMKLVPTEALTKK